MAKNLKKEDSAKNIDKLRLKSYIRKHDLESLQRHLVIHHSTRQKSWNSEPGNEILRGVIKIAKDNPMGLETIRLLIDLGALTESDKKGNLSEYADSSLILATTSDQVDVVDLLIQNGCEVNVKGSAYITLLMTAAESNYTKIGQLLISAGADVHFRNPLSGRSALMVAATNGHIDMVKLLVEAGANINDKDTWSRDALSLAKERNNKEVILYLSEVILAAEEKKELQTVVISPENHQSIKGSDGIVKLPGKRL